MNQPSKTELFWQSYLSTLPEEEQKNPPPYVVDQFADTPEAATSVGKLVRDGVKTTTAFWLRDNWDFLARECMAIGREPSETMPLVFQRFRVLYPQK